MAAASVTVGSLYDAQVSGKREELGPDYPQIQLKPVGVCCGLPFLVCKMGSQLPVPPTVMKDLCKHRK